MSEIEALLNFYGALDRAVVAKEVDPADLTPLLRPYAEGAAGWYDEQFLPWLAASKERAEKRRRDEARAARSDENQPAPEHPDAESAEEPAYAAEPELRPPTEARPALSAHAQEISNALSAFEARPLEGRRGARRLLAVAVAARALPQHFGPGGSHADIANAALVFQHPELTGDPVGRAHRLHERLADNFTEMSTPVWRHIVENSVADGSLPRSFAKQSDAPPCTGRLIMRPDPNGADLDPCTVLEAEFTAPDLPFEKAKNYLEPSNWVYPGSLWCRMEKVDPPLSPDSWVYHETVATSCPPTSAWWTVSTDLRFWFSHPTVNEARIEYDFPPGWPMPTSDIEIDEGSLRVIGLSGGGVRVITTKRVRFAGAFDGAGLAMFMCATGYTSALEDMVFSVVGSPNIQPFPVESPQGGTVSPQPNAKKTSSSSYATTTPPETEPLDDIVKEATDFVASQVKVFAETCTTSLKQIQDGNYKVENAWADGIKMWSSWVSGMTKALDLSTRAVKSAAPKPTDKT